MLFWTNEAENVSTVTVLSFAVTMKQKLNHKKYMVLGSLNTRYKTLIDTINFEAKYYIWLFRNNRKFNNKSSLYYEDFKRKLAYSDLVH